MKNIVKWRRLQYYPKTKALFPAFRNSEGDTSCPQDILERSDLQEILQEVVGPLFEPAILLAKQHFSFVAGSRRIQYGELQEVS